MTYSNNTWKPHDIPILCVKRQQAKVGVLTHETKMVKIVNINIIGSQIWHLDEATAVAECSIAEPPVWLVLMSICSVNSDRQGRLTCSYKTLHCTDLVVLMVLLFVMFSLCLTGRTEPQFGSRGRSNVF